MGFELNEPLGRLCRVVRQGSAAKWKSLEIPIISPELLTPSSDLNSQSHGGPFSYQEVSTRGVRLAGEYFPTHLLCASMKCSLLSTLLSTLSLVKALTGAF